MQSDEELVDAANRGDGEAFRLLYERYRDWVYALALRFTADRALALDVVQETFIYFMGKFPGFRVRAKLKTFLYPVVRHVAIAARSRQQRARGTGEVPPAFRSPTLPARELEGLALALDRLPAGQREVLILRFADGLALREIAEALAMPIGTVKSRLHLAIEALRADERLKSYFDVEPSQAGEP